MYRFCSRLWTKTSAAPYNGQLDVSVVSLRSFIDVFDGLNSIEDFFLESFHTKIIMQLPYKYHCDNAGNCEVKCIYRQIKNLIM